MLRDCGSTSKTIQENTRIGAGFVRAVSCDFVDRSGPGRKKARNQTKTLLIISLLMLSAGGAFAHPDKHEKKGLGSQVERAAAPNVLLSVCLASGDIKVHGWDRNQVRARANDTDEIELARPGAVRDSDQAKEITVMIGNQSRKHVGSCHFDGDIELDVPRGASVRLQTRDGHIYVADVAEVHAETVGGDVDLEGVKRSVEANTIGGAISLKNSSGSVKLRSIGGGIEAHGVGSAVASDVFEASTVGGDITLERISYLELKTSTIDGDLHLSGPLARGGRYDFKSISGDLALVLPADSSFRLDAKLSRGADLVTDFSLNLSDETTGSPRRSGSSRRKDETPDPGDLVRGSGFGMRHVNGVYGTGDASITVSSFSGSIYLRKK
jgi:hypothetical protein